MNEAGERVWRAQSDTDLTEIGHKIREAQQEFSDVLVAVYCPDEPPIEKNKTGDKFAAFRRRADPSLGGTDRKLLNAIEALWVAVNVLAQKLEHNSDRDGRPLELADAKRAVLLTYTTMAELTRIAERIRRP